ncbi:hypothetical protein [Allofournierella massiliensis]|uniref:VCBS repeat protein n=1 Tax=Allofournierella massiliensis TaxID=1650663 RepID=A0A4R1QYJ1_9FIRM|nr:hypothetical protein [Fournierella massiliensis]TCL57770.1 hypothetical protein EDD77_10944 [Fournierella massiliensis]
MKRMVLALLVLAAGLLCGCTGSMSSGVEELLRAPQLAGPQSSVQKAITAYLGEAPQLKYPQTGDILSPFLFGDWNGDGSMDAAALYTSSGMQNVCLAILEQTGGSWEVTQELEGLSAEVDSISTAAMSGDGGMQLLVGYVGTSGEKYLSVYAYQEHTLTQVMEQAYSQYELQDITGSGLKDLILIGPQSGEGVKVQLLTAIQGELTMAQELWLGPGRFSSCEGLHLSSGADGGYYLVLDGYNGTGTALASILLSYNAATQKLEEYIPLLPVDIYTESTRYSSLLTSTDIDGDGTVEIPVELAEDNSQITVGRLTFLQWMDYTSTAPEKSFGIADLENGFYLELPPNWEGNVLVTEGAQEGSWAIRSLTDGTGYLEVRVVDPSTEGGSYFRLGNVGGKKVQARILASHIGENGENLQPAALTDCFRVL